MLRLFLLSLILTACASPIEICDNGRDDDNDGRVDCEQSKACSAFCDQDGDGIDSQAVGGADCDDDDARVFPGSVEICDGVDNDCDGLVDPAGSAGGTVFTRDFDGDGFGSPDGVKRIDCVAPWGFAPIGDCDDNNAARFDANIEICDGFDNDCDELIDEADPKLSDGQWWYADEDSDGYGDPLQWHIGCPPPPNPEQPFNPWVPDGTDCNDRDPSVHPGAAEVCDNVPDNDCDGIVGLSEDADLDNDGQSVCGGDCDDNDPTRAERFAERCGNLIDDDCDGLVDLEDPDANVYTCEDRYCPPTDNPPFGNFQPIWETYNGCLLDPDAKTMCRPADAPIKDTHDFGRRLHRVGWREDTKDRRDSLFVFLPPGPGDDNDTIRNWALYAGFRVISVGYANDVAIDTLCETSSCYWNVRYEMMTGEDTTIHTDYGPADSVEGRLSTLLQHLVVVHPHDGWEDYLTLDNRVDWSKIVVGGWSIGAGQAAFVAGYHNVKGTMLISGPKDRVGEFVYSDELGMDVPQFTWASWFNAPRQTPDCKMYGAYHRLDYPVGDPPLIEGAWTALGFDFPAVNADTSSTRDASVFSTDRLPNDPACSPHNVMGRDQCIMPSLFEHYVNLLCNADAQYVCNLSPELPNITP